MGEGPSLLLLLLYALQSNKVGSSNEAIKQSPTGRRDCKAIKQEVGRKEPKVTVYQRKKMFPETVEDRQFQKKP